MNSYRAVWGVRFGSSGAAALLVLAGASLNGSGRLGWATAFAAGAGLLAVVAGVFYRDWRLWFIQEITLVFAVGAMLATMKAFNVPLNLLNVLALRLVLR